MNSNPAASKEPLTEYEKSHRRQSIWQIYLPLAGGIIIVIALMVLAVLITSQGANPAQQWADFSVIIVILPTCFGSLLTIAILVGSVVLLKKALHGTPSLFHKMDLGMQNLSSLTTRIMDKVAAPVIKTNCVKSGWDTFWQELFGRKTKP